MTELLGHFVMKMLSSKKNKNSNVTVAVAVKAMFKMAHHTLNVPESYIRYHYECT